MPLAQDSISGLTSRPTRRLAFGFASVLTCALIAVTAFNVLTSSVQTDPVVPVYDPQPQISLSVISVDNPAGRHLERVPAPRTRAPVDGTPSEGAETEGPVSLRWAAPLVSFPIHQRVVRQSPPISSLLPSPVAFPFEFEWVAGVDVNRLAPEVIAEILQAASRLKSVEAFAPGSGPNSNERMREWLSSDRTVVAGTPRAYAVLQLVNYGWGLDQWPYLDRMWWHESGWDPQTVDEQQGNAYGEFDPSKTWGIPQANPASKMASAGSDWMTNPETQVRWGLGYIRDIYGSPQAAWERWRQRAATGSYGWY
jgi:hypothetical protein